MVSITGGVPMKIFILLSCLAFSIQAQHILDTDPVIDGHNDLPYNIYNILKNNLTDFHFDQDLRNDSKWGNGNCNSCFTDLPRLAKGKVGAQFWVAYVACSTQYKDAVEKTLEQIDVIKRLVKRYPERLQFATSADDILNSFKNKKIASLIGVEGGHSIDSRLGVLRMYYELGVRYMTLTHSCNTPWADNSYVDDSGPVLNLTQFGKIMVKEMNRLGMLVDLSHVSYAVMNEAIYVSRAPVMFSHSSAYSISQHNRNVRDDTLRLVKKNRGIVMVNFYPGFISAANPANATIQTAADHINHIADIAGHDCVGIGADYDGVGSTPKGLEDVSKYPDLFDLLKNQNSTKWTNENLKKLSSKNLIRVLKEAEMARDSLQKEEPYQHLIPIEDLNAIEDKAIWQCRTSHNNTSYEPTLSDMKSYGNSLVFFKCFTTIAFTAIFILNVLRSLV